MTQSAPDWMILDRYVHRRDDKEAFPDESSAPLRASSYTSLGQKFEVAFLPANPPAISRFYVRWPGGTKPEEGDGTDIVAANRDLVLLRLTSVEYLEKSPYLKYTQDHFFCIASPEPDTHLQLKRLPVCRKKVTIPPSDNEEQETVLPYVFFPNTVGLLREFVNGSDEDDFVVAQLDKVSPIPGRRRMVAEVCVLRSRLSSDDGDGMWEVEKIEIQHEDVDYNGLWYWSTDDVVTFNKCICWVDYHRGGILFYDALKEKPTISYRRLNINNTSSTSCQTLPGMSRSLCMTREIDRKGYLGNAVLRFVDITRSDSCIFGPLELGSGFTIKSSTLSSQGSVWVEDVNITSEDLWISNISSGLPHEVLMFPLVSTQNFNEVHFLVSQYVEEIKKVSMVSLDLSNKEVLDIVPYMAGGEDIDMVKEKSHLLKGFISSRFPMFLKTKPGRREMSVRTEEKEKQKAPLNTEAKEKHRAPRTKAKAATQAAEVALTQAVAAVTQAAEMAADQAVETRAVDAGAADAGAAKKAEAAWAAVAARTVASQAAGAVDAGAVDAGAAKKAGAVDTGVAHSRASQAAGAARSGALQDGTSWVTVARTGASQAAEAAGARAFSAVPYRKSGAARAEASEAGPATKAKPATEHQAAGAARAGASEAGPATMAKSATEHQAAGAARAGASEAGPATKAKSATEHQAAGASEAGPATKAKSSQAARAVDAGAAHAVLYRKAGAARAGASEAGPATTMEHQAAGAARAGASEARPATKAKPATEHRRV